MKKEQKTTKSYIIGYLLSLVSTVIPYYLVASKTVTGTSLLATILGFAVLQMAIQIFFFLHLGRGPKPLYNVVFFLGTASIILVVVGGSIFIMNNLYRNISPSDVTTRLAQDEGLAQVGGVKTGACQEVYANHIVTIKDGKATPFHTDAHLCDTLTFINTDNQQREIAFGPHPQHQVYGGEAEFNIQKGYPKTINLNESGTHLFHDHDAPDTFGEFTVAP
ncbi:MAG TPA: cytochrome o ubiquinol oxidase subunit IV [Patescibacteria group bacterium]|nr:cytochrome o ubiquinol oxidase subunit IV [Patescibacteria group bacterium]